ARAEVHGGVEGAVAAVQVEPVGRVQVAGDDVEVAVAVHVGEFDVERQVGDERPGGDVGQLCIQQVGGRGAGDGEQHADVAPGAEGAAAVVEVAAVELPEGAGHQVEVAVVVDVAQRDAGGEDLGAADIVACGAGERRRRAVVEVELVGGSIAQLAHGGDHRED